MTNSSMTERQPKRRQQNMRFTFWNNAVSRFAKSANSFSTRLLSLRSMQNCLGTGGSKDQFSSNNSFERRQTNEIFDSPRQVNIWPHIRHNRSSSPLLQHGARMAISPSGWIRV